MARKFKVKFCSSLRSQCCKMRLFWGIFNHSVDFLIVPESSYEEIQELDMNWWHQVIIKLIKVKGMRERSKSNKITIQCFALFDSCARAMKRECMIRIRYENIFNVLLAFFSKERWYTVFKNQKLSHFHIDVLLSIPEYSWVSLSIAEHILTLLSITEHCWAYLNIAEHCWVFLSIAEYYIALLRVNVARFARFVVKWDFLVIFKLCECVLLLRDWTFEK